MILRESSTGRLTAGMTDRDCSLKLSAASFHSQHSFASSADSLRTGQDPFQAWPAAFDFAALSASGLAAMKWINSRRREKARSTYLSLCHILIGVSTRAGTLPLR